LTIENLSVILVKKNSSKNLIYKIIDTKQNSIVNVENFTLEELIFQNIKKYAKIWFLSETDQNK